MARRGVSEERRRAAALQAGRQMIARRERPLYRLQGRDGAWTVDGLSWVTVTASGRLAALEAARAAIATWLDVAPEAFDVEA